MFSYQYIGNIARSELCYLLSVMTLLLPYLHQKIFFLSQRAYHFWGNKFRSIASSSNTLSIKVVLLPEIGELRLRKNTTVLAIFIFCLLCSSWFPDLFSATRANLPSNFIWLLADQGDFFIQLRSGREHSEAVTVASRPFQQQSQAG